MTECRDQARLSGKSGGVSPASPLVVRDLQCWPRNTEVGAQIVSTHRAQVGSVGHSFPTVRTLDRVVGGRGSLEQSHSVTSLSGRRSVSRERVAGHGTVTPYRRGGAAHERLAVRYLVRSVISSARDGRHVRALPCDWPTVAPPGGSARARQPARATARASFNDPVCQGQLVEHGAQLAPVVRRLVVIGLDFDW